MNLGLQGMEFESLDGKVKRLARNDPSRYNVMLTILCLA
jgi:hypothetical protein